MVGKKFKTIVTTGGPRAIYPQDRVNKIIGPMDELVQFTRMVWGGQMFICGDENKNKEYTKFLQWLIIILFVFYFITINCKFMELFVFSLLNTNSVNKQLSI